MMQCLFKGQRTLHPNKRYGKETYHIAGLLERNFPQDVETEDDVG